MTPMTSASSPNVEGNGKTATQSNEIYEKTVGVNCDVPGMDYEEQVYVASSPTS